MSTESVNDTKSSKPKKDVKGITINVMGREFRIAAPDGEERQLVASVDLLNKKMKEIRDSGKVVGNERIAIMAALNIAHEHLQVADSGAAKTNAKLTAAAPNISIDEDYVKRKMRDMEAMIEKAITDQEKLF